jgi:hypothetical protein
MWDLCRLTWWVLVDLFRPRAKLEAEILVLRQQINVLRRTAPKRFLLSSVDRLILVGLYRLFPDVRGALAIVKPDTVIRWHRAGFRAYGSNLRIAPQIQHEHEEVHERLGVGAKLASYTASALGDPRDCNIAPGGLALGRF